MARWLPRLRHLRPSFALVFRFEWLAWLVLAVLLAAAGMRLPDLKLRFAFQDVLAEDHPARKAYQEYERDFELGPRIYAYFHGPDAFEPRFLELLERVSARLERIPKMRSVYSPIDLRTLESKDLSIRLRRVLSPAVIRDPEALERALAAPPFDHLWRRLLYDDALSIYTVVMTPGVDGSDPREVMDCVERVRRELDAVLAECDVDLHLNGIFFVNSESFRVTLESQSRVSLLSAAIQLLVCWLLFGSLVISLQVMLLLNLSIALGFGAMAWLGIPMNFMSGNFPVMIMVIGVADLVHILGAYSRALTRHAPRTAALWAMRRTFFPNLFTTLTTLGCIFITTYTELDILRQFCLALSAGILIVWAVTIVYGPLLLMRSGMVPGRGLIYRLQQHIQRALDEGWLERVRRPSTLLGFALLALVTGALTATQRINSNWFRYYTADQPVSRALDFLHAHDFPVSVVDCTVRSPLRVGELLEDERWERDMELLAERIRALPGVVDAYTLYTHKRFIDHAWDRLEFPPDLEPRWRRARRRAFYRQFLQGGLFDDYYSAVARRLRIAVTSSLEDSVDFLELRRRILETVHAAELEVVDPDGVELTGQMLYWTVIIDSISSTFFRSLLGSLAVILVCFLALTRRLRHSLLAVIPNLLPLLAIFAVARLLGYELREDFCFLVSLSIGIAVDDTLHFLYHYRLHQDRGEPTEDCVRAAFTHAGSPMVLTSGILMIGFSACLVAHVVPMILTGVLVCVSVGVALAADLMLVPALLLWMDGKPRGGKPRGSAMHPADPD